MRYLDLTLATPVQNLALDEALLEWAEVDRPEREILRLWEPPQPIVVGGRSSHIAKEINEAACGQRGIPILRRSSGGAAIVTGPGCLMYALVLSHEARPDLKDIGRAHAFVLERLVASLGTPLAHAGTVARAGTCDLVLRDHTAAAIPLKFSGNSLRMKRTHLLYHGTLLYAFDLALIDTCLRMPPRQPDYRNGRPHSEFVRNVPATRQQLAEAVRSAWPAASELTDFPMSRVDELVASRFGRHPWNYEFP